MIQSLTIQNFQSHKNSLLEFDPGVNVIVGTSDSGKSAILRSLRWLVFNRPGGDAVRSWWGGDTHVSIETEFHRIAKNKNSNSSYVLGSVDEEEVLEFKAFNTTVPKEIQDALNMSEINMQKQMDSPFLLGDSFSAGDVALHFNKVANLDRIDKAQQNVEKEIRSLNSDIAYKKAEQIKLQQKLESYDYLEKYEIELEVLEEMDKRKNNITKNISKFTRHINSLVDLENEIETASEILQDEDYVEKLVTAIAVRDGKIVDKRKLKTLLVKYADCSMQIKNTKSLLLLETTLNDILDTIEKRKTETNRFVRLNGLFKSLNDIKILIDKNNRNLSLQTNIFKKEMPKVCPLCGK